MSNNKNICKINRIRKIKREDVENLEKSRQNM